MDREKLAVWDRARLERRKAELEEGLRGIEDQFRQVYNQQRGAIALIEEMLAGLEGSGEDAKSRAARRRAARADRRARQAQVELPEPVPQSANGAEAA